LHTALTAHEVTRHKSGESGGRDGEGHGSQHS
jgi:hypothetical protein